MTQQDFSYEGNVALKSFSNDLEIKDICFLTPARVSVVENGIKRDIDLSVDIVNKVVYVPGKPGPSPLTEKFFAFLNNSISMPEDLFRAGPEITDVVQEIQEEHKQIMEKAEWE